MVLLMIYRLMISYCLMTGKSSDYGLRKFNSKIEEIYSAEMSIFASERSMHGAIAFTDMNVCNLNLKILKI